MGERQRERERQGKEGCVKERECNMNFMKREGEGKKKN